MEKMDLTESSFWSDPSCRVMVNERDPRAVAEAEVIQSWVNQESSLAGHLLFSTSGSSGGAKWVALSREAILASAQSVNTHLNVSTEDRWLLALPTFHVGGTGIVARSYLSSSSMVRYQGPWSAASYLEVLNDEDVTLSSLVPTQLVDLVRLGVVAPPSLRAVLIGGGRLDDVTYQQAMDLGWPVVETYGMTETCSQVATASLGERSLKLLPPWQAKTDARGRLMLKGAPLLTGYVSCEHGQVTFADPRQGGWFEAGDIVALHEDTLSVMGRADRCVKVLGELVDLEEVTRNLKADLRTDMEVVVIPFDDVRKGASLIACTEGQPIDEGRLSFYNSQCHPLHRIDRTIAVEKIPRSPLGKVQYGKLLTQVAQQIESP